MEERHQKVQERINSNEAREAEELASQMLIKINKGCLVYLQYNRRNAETIKEVETAEDNGDILLFRSGNPNGERIEVKRLSSSNYYAYFEELTDFRNGFIVDGVNQFEKKHPKPILYMTFNYPMTKCAVTYSVNKPNWNKRKTNSNFGGEKEYYVSKISDVKLIDVNNLLKN